MRLRGDQTTARNPGRWLFYLVTAFHLIPLFTLHFFPSVDGPAHVYNASIIKGLITGNDLYKQFYEFNYVIEPNWLGHALLTLLSFIFPPLLAEKIFLACCIIALPVSFRQLILRINPHAALSSWIIFPFIYSFMLITGFYNFCLSLPLFFWATLYWMNIKDTLRPVKLLFFSLLLLLLYLCHIMAFGLMGLIAGLLLLPSLRDGAISFLKRAALLALASAPALFLAWKFVRHHSTAEPGFYYEAGTLWKWIYTAQPLMAYDYTDLTFYAAIIFYLICALILFTIIRKFAERRFTGSDMWVLAAVMLLLCYFLLPDTSAGGGFISIRLLYYSFLFFAVWVCTQDHLRWVKMGTAVIAAAASLGFLFRFHAKLEEEDIEAQEYHSLAKHIEANSVVMPVNYGNRWRDAHYSNYLSYEKPLIILENYEASSKLFPLLWKSGLEPYTLMGNITGWPPCADTRNYTERTGKQIDYIVQWKYTALTDTCSTAIEEELKKNYTPVMQSEGGHAVLFRRKGS
jgi:hypothetical protein